MNTERNCQLCKFYKDGYCCEVLELKPCYPEKGCDYFEERIPKYIKAEVLDKIRAEIVHLHDWAFDRDEVLKIIDKYKAESEE